LFRKLRSRIAQSAKTPEKAAKNTVKVDGKPFGKTFAFLDSL